MTTTTTTAFVQFGKSKIGYDVVRSQKRKKVEIVVLHDTKVKVLAPAEKPMEEITQIVKSRSRWIFQKQLKLSRQYNKLLSYSDGSTLPYLGREYLLRIFDIESSDNDSFSFNKSKFIVKVKDKDDDDVIKHLYEKWLENRAINLLEKKVNEYSMMFGITQVLRVNIKSQKKRLGSLGRNLTLNFNKNLVKLPPKIIDYIVVHELCHTKIPNHSRAYWQLVGLIMPDYKKRKEWLQMNKHIVIIS